MTKQRKRIIQDFLLGFLLSTALFGAPYLKEHGFLPAIPYGHVELQGVTEVEEGFIASFSFAKTDQCVFEKLGVFGSILGKWEEIEWKDVNGNSGDRLRGEHTLNLLLKTEDRVYTEVEVRVRHNCDGKKKDSLFYRLTGDDLYVLDKE